MDWLGLVQWPAMAVTVLAAYFAASKRKWHRRAGFWTFLASNALWIAWGIGDRAYALVLLQVVLAAMNLRGVKENQPQEPAKE
jgi:hypothetical protein